MTSGGVSWLLRTPHDHPWRLCTVELPPVPDANPPQGQAAQLLPTTSPFPFARGSSLDIVHMRRYRYATAMGIAEGGYDDSSAWLYHA